MKHIKNFNENTSSYEAKKTYVKFRMEDVKAYNLGNLEATIGFVLDPSSLLLLADIAHGFNYFRFNKNSYLEPYDGLVLIHNETGKKYRLENKKGFVAYTIEMVDVDTNKLVALLNWTSYNTD